MAYRLPGSRHQLDLDGPSVEVEPCLSWAIQHIGIGLYRALDTAEEANAHLAALQNLGRLVLAEAMPTWDIMDHHGPVPATEAGWLRIPDLLAQQIAVGWLNTYTAEQPSSAVDALIPEGPMRNEIKRRLRAVKAA